ncbi:lysozyme inhibitor LprI family protein [Psychrobacillus sp. NPDC096426]|uniref:lysozyme inhibitor LprI family protein n=1 Tax=Psychrobacillus sp. NPDC096426 TaxID=3364491 RepID=UPI003818BEA2
MKNNRKTLTVIFTLVLVILAACGNPTDELSTKSNNDSSGNDSTQNRDEDSSNADRTENSLEDADDTKSKKEEYLKILNDMEEADRYSNVGTTMLELEEQEAERNKKWDVELNQIYGVLKEQLGTEQMDKLREEQRNWVKHRDEIAKESSLKYKGGSMESLEYVATQAILTRERCYELIAKYMK